MKSTRRYTDADVIAALEAAISDAGSLRKLARLWGVSATFLSAVRHGKCPPGAHVAERLGFVEDGKRWVRK